MKVRGRIDDDQLVTYANFWLRYKLHRGAKLMPFTILTMID